MYLQPIDVNGLRIGKISNLQLQNWLQDPVSKIFLAKNIIFGKFGLDFCTRRTSKSGPRLQPVNRQCSQPFPANVGLIIKYLKPAFQVPRVSRYLECQVKAMIFNLQPFLDLRNIFVVNLKTGSRKKCLMLVEFAS